MALEIHGDSTCHQPTISHDFAKLSPGRPALLQPYAQRHGTWHSWAVHGAVSTNSLAALGAPLLPAEANADVPGPGWSDGGCLWVYIMVIRC